MCICMESFKIGDIQRNFRSNVNNRNVCKWKKSQNRKKNEKNRCNVFNRDFLVKKKIDRTRILPVSFEYLE